MIALSLLVWVVQFSARQVGVAGQGTTAVCESSFSWMSNSLGQSPCLVSSYLLLPCDATSSSFVFPLTAGEHYNLPSSTTATLCRCNTVFYSMISACATCQGQGAFIPTWSDYSAFCTSPDIQSYPEDINSGTAVPAWAYIDVRTVDDFSPVQAQAVASEGLPESTALSSGSTATSVRSASAIISGSATGAPRSTTTSSGSGSNSGSNSGSGSGSGSGDDTTSTKKSTNIAPIVGGVVGGVVGAIVIGLALWFFVRRRRNATRNAPTGPVDLTAGEYGQYAEKPTDYSQGAYGFPAPIPSPLASPKVYNPDDPTTFPDNSDARAPSSHDTTAVASSPIHAHYDTMPYSYPAPAGSPYSPIAGTGTNPTYKGAPEL
ncbi:hypothetical protein C2E23DRAFT_820236 [Lenzites betulinus]|nr:hypothetical protein C2E23DRAFT_820236 [Lenzites betulinus]